MIEISVAILISIVAVFFILRSVATPCPMVKPEVETIGHETRVLMSEDVKAELAKMEQKVFEKAEEAKRIAEHETSVFPAPLEGMAAPSPHNPLEESAVMKSITQKVEKVRKLSEQK